MNEQSAELIERAQRVLKELGFAKAQSNRRSALTLLSLLELRPGDSWADATRNLHGVTPLMDWMADHFGKRYAPNTRETVRRQTLHQFRDAALVALNPDNPRRAINSKDNSYQVDPEAFELLTAVDSADWDERLAEYLELRPGLEERYAAARQQALTPVRLPSGRQIRLTPGGQNELIREIIEEFCPRWTPGGEVLYVGDAGAEDPVFDLPALESLGFELDKHGKLPDLIVYVPKQDWLVLIEAASSHGPIDGKRLGELEILFGQSDLGLIFVSCFPSRAVMRKFLVDLAWETEAWCADSPSHLIHLNGNRFFGPA